MQTTLALVALATAAFADPMLQARAGVTSDITPSSPEPTGFSYSYSGAFQITAATLSSKKRGLEKVRSSLSCLKQ